MSDRIKTRKAGLTSLKLRQKAWDDMRADYTSGTNVKIINGSAYRRPGSQKKH